MNILVQPALDGVAAERLLGFAVKIAAIESSDGPALRSLAEREAAWANRSQQLNGQAKAYEAAARLLVDLRLLKWRIRADNYGLELESPPSPRLGPRTPDAIRESKEAVRRELAPALARQFADQHVRRFIRDLEAPPPGSRRRSVVDLIAEGSELCERLGVSFSPEPQARSTSTAIQPYLQLVPGESESVVHDKFTGISLSDIWRYFRFTWNIPQTAIPGRQLFYLIRDRAHRKHAVMGIACLANSPLLSPERDNQIGWTADSLRERLLRAGDARDTASLSHLRQWLNGRLDLALAHISLEGLLDPSELENPTDAVVARLQRKADEFSGRRQDALRDVAQAASLGLPLTHQDVELGCRGIPPVALNVLELEGKRAPAKSPETKARRLLVAKKRAFELARLLRSRLVLRRFHAAIGDPARVKAVLADAEFSFALNTILMAAKGERVGTSILEITTCGAIPPYNHLLGGKLVALLLLSPEIADDYRKRYGQRPSIIGSQLKNMHRTKDCTLAWLNTTSLYSLGSSQYERVRLPAGIISTQQAEIRYQYIGDTEGYGTVQFSEATVKAIQEALEERWQFRSINSIFGEGFSPKFRKLRDGMLMLGFNPTVLMRHDQARRVYAAKLWPTADRFLRGEADKVPDYVEAPDRFRQASERIAEFWRTRWLGSRLRHEPSLDAVRAAKPRFLSDEVGGAHVNENESRAPNDRSSKAAERMGPPPVPPAATAHTTETLAFWHRIAQAGPEVCADELSAGDLARLHVGRGLDDFLLKRVEDGYSIVLTGNAGDGKTHLLRRLEPQLVERGAIVEGDATAAMRPNDISPVLRRWKRAASDGKPFCLAANEYPLHLLRMSGRTFAPIAEVDRQCQHRLVYSETPSREEASSGKVLVVDLSLRNPLDRDFASGVLRQMLAQQDIRSAAKENPESDLAWNYARLSAPVVQDRLLQLLARIAAAGQRVTVRELWIWMVRLLFGGSAEDRTPVRSPGRWYASRLFDSDGRFEIARLLRSLVDPAKHSHPRWDLELECRRVTNGWSFEPPVVSRLDAQVFAAVKRLFYFEHQRGEDVFALGTSEGDRLLSALQSKTVLDAAFKRSVIEAINLAYCPVPFPQQMSTRLYLWIGHRFHEQPSHGHCANQSISEEHLQLLCPRLPSRLEGAFAYQPDHLLLQYAADSGTPVRLRLDYPLFVALDRVRNGLPRQLLPDRETNRLDAFLEQLRRLDIPRMSEFFIHNHDERTSLQVTLSSDLRSYQEVRTP